MPCQNTNTTGVTTRARRAILRDATGSYCTGCIAPVAYISFGNGAIFDSETGDPMTPNEWLTSLNSETARYKVDSISKQDDITTIFSVTIPANDLNGVRINEAGLIDENGVLLAIQYTPTITKPTGIEITYQFMDSF